MNGCHVEVFWSLENGGFRWGWQCFTHHLEETGFSGLTAAEQAGDDHARLADMVGGAL